MGEADAIRRGLHWPFFSKAKASKEILGAGALEARLLMLSDVELDAEILRVRGGGQTSNGPGRRAAALAVSREACRRVLGLRAFDTQLLAAMSLHEGKIVEMATGEGKTLAAVIAAFLNSIDGHRTHVAVPNPYLAERDYLWSRPAYARVGMRSGLVVQNQRQGLKRRSYSADVVYSTFSEFGFDYLRDNTMKTLDGMVQSGHECVIIDEVDSILIDEGRTPLVISVPVQPDARRLSAIDEIVKALDQGDVDVNVIEKWASFTDAGVDKLEENFIEAGLMARGTELFDNGNTSLSHAAIQALRANCLYTRNEDYVVKGDEIVLLNQQSGRLLPGRRLSDGLHSALEAKERVVSRPENRAVASISVQNYFKRYSRLSGMSGTIMTESDEIRDVYGVETVAIPTNRPVSRIDRPDQIVDSLSLKHELITESVLAAHRAGRPVLVGTTTIEQSEQISDRLTKLGISHNLLNAFQTDSEARIIAEAGRLGAVTIATNMAGRGTDIQLGGSPSQQGTDEDGQQSAADGMALPKREEEANRINALGGLLVIGTEKADCRRIDNQLRGRAGRQGDPGESRFILSMEDDFVAAAKLGARKDLRDVERRRELFNAEQRRRETASLKVRINLLKLDNVLNEQRAAIFSERMEILRSNDLWQMAVAMRESVVDALVAKYCGEAEARDPDLVGLIADCVSIFNLDPQLLAGVLAPESRRDVEAMRRRLSDNIGEHLMTKYSVYSPEALNDLCRVVLLEVLDESWRQHFEQMEVLMSGIALRSLGKRDPVTEFRTDAFELFEQMMAAIPEQFCRAFCMPRPKSAADQNALLKSLLGIGDAG